MDMKVLLNSKHDFDQIIIWLFDAMPKDQDPARWTFVDEVDPVVAGNSDTRFMSDQRTYIIFKDERDALMFALRWS
jgi:hypothetical protein